MQGARSPHLYILGVTIEAGVRFCGQLSDSSEDGLDFG
jgi:hypothetical protein